MARQINRLTLSFRDPFLENEYISQKLQHDASVLGWISFFTLIVGLAYFLYELINAPSSHQDLWWVRHAYVIPACVITAVCTRIGYIRERRIWITVFSVLFFLSITISVVHFAALNLETRTSFLSGCVIVLFACALFSGFHFKWLFFFLVTQLIIIVLLSYKLDLDPGFRFNTISQVIATLFLALAGCYLQESLQRENFISSKKIAISRRRLIEKARVIAEENLFKDTLLSIIAHDFRGPLASLTGTIHLASNNYLTPEETGLNLKRLGEELEKVNLMSERVLNWVKGQMNGIRIRPEEFNVHQLTETNFQLYSSHAQPKSIKLVNSVPQEFVIVSDINLVNTVLRNLISNAIKFSHTGEVIVSAGRNDLGHTIQCVNKGLEFNAEQLEKMQEALGSTKGTRNEVGFGMGVKMCNDLLKYLDSRLVIQSSPDGLTRISFLLPSVPVISKPHQEGELKPD